MNSLKSHFSLIFALICLLASYQLYLSVADMTAKMEDKLKNDYCLVAVSSKQLKSEELHRQSRAVKDVENIDPTPHLGYLRQDLSPENYALLQETLPYFYKVRLSHYPSADELKSIEQRLRGYPGIIKVESFAKTQNSSYSLLAGLKNLLLVFIAAIFIINLLLFSKFMEVWRYEHTTRMQIMAIFGAPLWMRGVVLIKMAILDAILSLIVTIALFWLASTRPEVTAYVMTLGIEGGLPFDLAKSAAELSLLAFSVSLISVSFVAFRSVEE